MSSATIATPSAGTRALPARAGRGPRRRPVLSFTFHYLSAAAPLRRTGSSGPGA